jgi:diaminopimelate epimerase
MSKIPFWKIQTIGNHFVLVHEKDAEGLDLAVLAEKMCTKQWGIGADGLLVLSPMPEGSDYQVEMRMFNPDGTEDFCGNGVRCAAVHAAEQNWASGRFIIRQKGIPVQVEVFPGSEAASWLPAASFESSKIPFTGTREEKWATVQGVKGVPVSTGTTHFVVPVDQLPGDEVFRTLSPRIEEDPAFPERTSIMWTEKLGERHIRLRIWERGVGPTLGCGTGSSAAALVTALTENTWGEILVENPGGSLKVSVESEDGEIRSQSKVEIPFFGTFDA